MRMKSLLVAATGIVLVIVIGIIGYHAFEEVNEKRRFRESSERELADAHSFASCVAQKLSVDGMEQLVVHQYKPAGIIWKEQIKYFADMNLGKPATPEGDRLFAFKRMGNGMDWNPFQDLVKLCDPVYGPPFSELWRAGLWSSLESNPMFQNAVAKIKSRNDVILGPERKRVTAKRLVMEEAEKAQRQARNKEIFREEMPDSKP